MPQAEQMGAKGAMNLTHEIANGWVQEFRHHVDLKRRVLDLDDYEAIVALIDERDRLRAALERLTAAAKAHTKALDLWTHAPDIQAVHRMSQAVMRTADDLDKMVSVARAVLGDGK